MTRSCGTSIRAGWGPMALLTIVLYATLPIGNRVWELVGALLGSGRDDLAIAGLLTVGTVGAVAWRVRLRALGPSGWSALGLAVLGYAVALASIELNSAEKMHFLTYGWLAWLVRAALSSRLRGSGREVVTAAIVAAIGLGDEGIQYLLPNRVFEWKDVGLNAISGILAIIPRAVLPASPTPSA